MIYIAPLAGWWIGWQTDRLTLFLIFIVFLAFLAYLYLCNREYPGLVKEIRISLALVKSLVSYSSWVAVSNFVAPLLTYLDRFLISNIISIGVLAYYTAPYEALTRLWLIPMSLTATLFPAFSRIENQSSDDISQENITLLRSSLKFIVLLLGPVSILIILFPKDILKLWIDAGFAQESSTITQILMVGIFINSLGRIPSTLLYGKGRPDIPAKLHLIELPGYIILAVILIKLFGIAGASYAWTIRVAIDAALLFWMASKNGFISTADFLNKYLGLAITGLTTILCIGGILNIFGQRIPFFQRVGTIIFLLMAFTIVAWFKILERSEQESMGRFIRRIIRKKNLDLLKVENK